MTETLNHSKRMGRERRRRMITIEEHIMDYDAKNLFNFRNSQKARGANEES